MKKLATLLVLFSLAIFAVAPMVGCGDKDAADDGGAVTTDDDADAGSGDKEDGDE